MKLLLRKIGKIPCISLLFNKFIVAGFKNRPNLQLLINTIWKLCQKKRQGRESRKHSDISGATKEIYKNFRQDLHSVMRDILQGPFEYKLGVRSTQSDIHIQANTVQLIFSILLQHHISKRSRCFWSTARSVQVSAPYKAMLQM